MSTSASTTYLVSDLLNFWACVENFVNLSRAELCKTMLTWFNRM